MVGLKCFNVVNSSNLLSRENCITPKHFFKKLLSVKLTRIFLEEVQSLVLEFFRKYLSLYTGKNLSYRSLILIMDEDRYSEKSILPQILSFEILVALYRVLSRVPNRTYTLLISAFRTR